MQPMDEASRRVRLRRACPGGATTDRLEKEGVMRTPPPPGSSRRGDDCLADQSSSRRGKPDEANRTSSLNWLRNSQ